MLDGTDHRTSSLASVLGLIALTSLVFGLRDLGRAIESAVASREVPAEAVPAETPHAPPPVPVYVPALATPPTPGLAVPVAGVGQGELTRQFDEHRSGGRSHRAIDILAPCGTPVLAANDGRIERLLHNRLGGHTIYQRDPARGFVYYYAHLQRYRAGLSEGDEVRRGEVIGYVGTSGNAPPATPHLHFAIHRVGPEDRWWQGEPIDPFDELAVSRLATR
jgi:murein DD-endopeptidase MepM/ murein hydrolase activator NlpD